MKKNTFETLWEVMDHVRGSADLDHHSMFIALYISQKLKKTIDEIIANFDDEPIKSALQKVSGENGNVIERFQQLPILSDIEWLEFVTKTSIFEYNDTGIQKTPISIIKLVDQLLEIKDNDSLLDVCSGIGVTLAYLSMDKDVKLMGIEINEQTYIHSKLLLDVIHKNTTKIIFADALKTDLTPFNANKVFINGPIGFKFPKDKYEDIFEKKFSRTNYEKLIPKHDSSWIFVLDAILHSNFEKIVVVMNEASLVNNREIMIRKQLIEDGYIEAVIDLPEGLLDYSNIPVSLLILSKNNKNVKFVDATKLGSKK